MATMQGTEDLDGDGNAEILITSPWHAVDYEADSGTREGALHVISGLASSASLDMDLGTSATSGIIGASAELLFGFRAVEDDFDGDGVSDLIVTALGDSTGETMSGGAIFSFSNAGDDMGTSWAEADTLSDGHIYGNDENGYLGYSIEAVGDINGNGINDLLMTEVYGGVSGLGFVWLLDGSELWSETEVSDAAMYAWYASTENADVGYSLAGGHDIDGDGINDMAIGSLGYGNGAGRVEILLSDDL
jgi:hypothetical protein